MATPLRDQRIGRLLAARKCRAIWQGEYGGTARDNVIRLTAWRNRIRDVPLEEQIKSVGYVPIPRYLSLVLYVERA